MGQQHCISFTKWKDFHNVTQELSLSATIAQQNINLMLQIITIQVLCQYKKKRKIAANKQDTDEEHNHSELKNPTNFRNKNYVIHLKLFCCWSSACKAQSLIILQPWPDVLFLQFLSPCIETFNCTSIHVYLLSVDHLAPLAYSHSSNRYRWAKEKQEVNCREQVRFVSSVFHLLFMEIHCISHPSWHLI